ncbi:hypothetical protein TELCIR_09138 [Teladorsagia circumcincta]|uniref:Mariner Mos1 transposase n=1 Tax=Teladorsagia circumcincta TaxID=45464 RepID=A0A2G9UFK9_TELCI|nr:hypothetical protein TELCIR_09138 [Teladorsagia circumcincta]
MQCGWAELQHPSYSDIALSDYLLFTDLICKLPEYWEEVVDNDGGYAQSFLLFVTLHMEKKETLNNTHGGKKKMKFPQSTVDSGEE